MTGNFKNRLRKLETIFNRRKMEITIPSSEKLREEIVAKRAELRALVKLLRMVVEAERAGLPKTKIPKKLEK